MRVVVTGASGNVGTSVLAALADVGRRMASDAYRRALVEQVRGPFNIAAEPVLDPGELGRLLHARPVPLSAGRGYSVSRLG
jgi:nucleoside-diphosphate-sugar epimerase